VELFACGFQVRGPYGLHKIALDHFQRGVSEGLFLLPVIPNPDLAKGEWLRDRSAVISP